MRPRTGAPAGHHGYFHETAYYDSDDAFCEIVVPFVEGGIEAGEPTVVACAPPNTAILRRELASVGGVTFLSGGEQYLRPASAIAAYRKLFAALVDDGAPQIRVVGDVPHPGTGASWDWWARYEATVNHAYDAFPLWGLCPYDTRTTPAWVLDDVARTHPFVATAGGGHARNPRFEAPARFLAGRSSAPDPAELATPTIELVDPSPAVARHAVGLVARDAGIDEVAAGGLLTSVSEIVTNALVHGRPPVRLRAWTADGRVVVAVTDTGAGPADPYAGLLPVEGDRRDGGLGLWLAHQLCDDVTFASGDDGFTVRLLVRIAS